MNGDSNGGKELRVRLSKLSEAGLRISESLDLDRVLPEVVNSARALTNARYGAITTLDDSARFEDFHTSGLTPTESRLLADMPGVGEVFEYLSRLREPLRIPNLSNHIGTLGLPDVRLPIEVSSILTAPIRYRGLVVGSIYLGRNFEDEEFTPEDEEVLVRFASLAALVISNARIYGREWRARADLEALIDTSPVGVVVFDAETKNVVSLNQEAGRILGDPRMPVSAADKLMSRLNLHLSDGRKIPLGEYPLIEVLSAGKTVRAEEVVIEVPDVHQITTLINTTPIHSESGEVTSVVVTLQDMTPLKELERLRADFLGMVSHELRTPLTSIKGSAATALESSSPLNPAETRQVFRIINEQADLMRNLINDLLDVTRIETGTLSVAPEPTGAAGLVDQARTLIQSSGVRNVIDLDIPTDLPLVQADPQRIVQVLCNLLSNAARYSPSSSVITIIVRQADVHVLFSVVDEGMGISSDELPNLFSRAPGIGGSGSAIQRGGYGMGLAICRGIVEAHGGRIWAESDGPQLGARVNFTIPVAESVGTTAAESTPSAYQEDQQQRILVVDDDPQVLRYVREILTIAGFTTIVTGEPDVVEPLMRAEQPNLVLMDLMLPGSDGVDLMRRIAEISDVPVIFLSAYGRDRYVVRALEMGATDYVVKPFSPTELVARIRAALRKQAYSIGTAFSEIYALGDLKIDYSQRLVTVADEPVRLTATEYAVLAELSANSGRVLTHDQLLRRVWGIWASGDPRLVRSFIKKIRRKLRDDARQPAYIFTEPGVGYRMGKPLGGGSKATRAEFIA